MIIDLPPGTGDIQISLAQQVNLSGAVIVSTQDVALLDVIKAISMFEKAGVKVSGMMKTCPLECQIVEEWIIFLEKRVFQKRQITESTTFGEDSSSFRHKKPPMQVHQRLFHIQKLYKLKHIVKFLKNLLKF